MVKEVVQKTSYDCFVASLAMVMDIPYKKARKMVKRGFRGKFSIPKKVGTPRNDIPKFMTKIDSFDSEAEIGEYNTIFSYTKGMKGILILQFANGGGHAVYCDGCKIFEVTHGDWYDNVYRYVKRNPCTITGYYRFKTPIYRRIVNFFKSLSYKIDIEVKCIWQDIVRSLSKLKRLNSLTLLLKNCWSSPKGI